MSFSWPNDCKAAVSLSYDDGYPSFLDIAVPALDARKLHGTFYLTGSFPAVLNHVPQWRAAFVSGHEIGNHTLTHPCDPLIYSPDFADINVFINQQTGITEAWFLANGLSNGQRSFAYPCGITALGPPGAPGIQEKRYKDVCEMTFNCARVAAGPPNDPAQVVARRFLLASHFGTWGQDTAIPSISYCQDSLDKGFWGVLGFHDLVEGGVPTEGQTRTEVHAEVLDWLIAHDQIWVAPVIEVYEHVLSHQIAAAT